MVSEPQKPIYPRDLWHHNRWDELRDDQIVDWKRTRAVIEHENQLINHRITWLLLLQGALVTWSGESIAKVLGVEQCTATSDCHQIESLLPVALIGALVSIFISFTLSQAEKQIQGAVEWWKKRVGDHDNEWFHPPIFPSADWISYSHKYSVLGWLFSCFWGAVLIGGVINATGQGVSGSIVAKAGVAAMLLFYAWFFATGLRSKKIERRSLSFCVGILLAFCFVLGALAVLWPIAGKPLLRSLENSVQEIKSLHHSRSSSPQKRKKDIGLSLVQDTDFNKIGFSSR